MISPGSLHESRDFSHFTRKVIPFRIGADFDSGFIPRAGLTDSKLGGAPYRPLGSGWPHQMYLLAQINLDHTPTLPLFPTTGLLQFFMCYEPGYGMFSPHPRCHVNYWQSYDAPAEPALFFDAEQLVPERDSFSTTMLDPYAVLQDPGYALPLIAGEMKDQLPQIDEDIESDQHGRAEILEYIHGRNWSETELMEFTRGTACGGIQLGGYPNLVQTDFDSPGADELLLFQVDWEPPAIWPGDCGSVQFFIQPEDLKARRFDQVRFYFSCG